MATAISPIMRQVSKPYLTLQEFKNAPTALDYNNLVVGGNQAAQDAELSNAILRASSYIDQHCNQIIGATVDVEQQRTRMRSDGTLRFHPKNFPIVALLELNVGFQPNNLTAVNDPSQAWLEEGQVVFPLSSLPTNTSSQGPLGFGFPSSPRVETYINYTYVNGYANTEVSTLANAGSSTLVVADGTGFQAGEQFTIYDGANTERVTVASNYVFDSNTIPLTAPLAFSHAVGVSVSALPAAIKQACILVTSTFLKIRGDASLVMEVTSTPRQQIPDAQNMGSDLAIAKQLLAPFRRIR
jgi:hypothetical protein